MEELQRVLRAEPERVVGVGECGCALPVARERPRERVVAVDRRPLVERLVGERHGRRRCDVVVGVEDRDLEVAVDAVRREQLVDDRDQAVLLPRGRLVSGRAVQIAEKRDVLR